MNEKKIFQQKILAQILVVCGFAIILMSFFLNKMNTSTFFGVAFLTIGFFTFWKARRDEDELKK